MVVLLQFLLASTLALALALLVLRLLLTATWLAGPVATVTLLDLVSVHES